MPADERLGVVTKNCQHRQPDLLASAQGFAEDWSLGNGQPHVKTEENQHGACQERKPPTKREKLLVGKRTGKQQERSPGKQETGRRAELRKHTVPCALVRRRILNGQQYGSAPLAS